MHKTRFNHQVMLLHFPFTDRVKDDYLANRLLRDQMRLKRKSAQATAASDKALLSKSSLPQGERFLTRSKANKNAFKCYHQISPFYRYISALPF